MPWKVVKRRSQYCVEKIGEGTVPGGCHDTREKAVAHQRALYAGEAQGKQEASIVEWNDQSLAALEAMMPGMSKEASAEGGTVMSVKTIGTVQFSSYPSTATAVATENPLSASTVTITVNEDSAAAEEAGVPSDAIWEGPLAFEGKPTDDKRLLMKDKIDHRELPLPMMAQTVTEDGHRGAELAARIDEIWWQEAADDPNVMEIWGRGPFDSGPAGQEAARLVDEGFLTGVSIDFAPTDVMLLDPETLEPVDTEGVDIFDLLMGDWITGMAGSIMGATLVPFPAFEDAKVGIVTASGMKVIRTALTASAAGMAPLMPPKDWFEMPEPDLPHPLTVTDDGRVYGHLGLWDQCHTGFDSVCRMPPRSQSDYSHFHLGEIETAEGERIAVGKITVGDKGHAPIHMNAAEAVKHYDNTGCVGAFVRARNGRLGIWLSGAVRSDAPAEKIRDMMANPPSGDWRSVNGSLELQGVLSVPIPGFPIPRSEARLVASGEGDVIEALVASGYGDAPLGPRAIQRRRGVLRARLVEALGLQRRQPTRAEIVKMAIAEELAGPTAEERRKAADKGEALPDGSFPIRNCAEAEKAIHAQGRASDQDKVVRHIKKRVKALGCTGDIFEPYR